MTKIAQILKSRSTLVLFLTLSLGLNLAAIIKYNLMHKGYHRLRKLVITQKPKPYPNKPVVFYLRDVSVQTLAPQTDTDQEAQAIPEQLIIPPGAYAFEGGHYALNKEGLYRFVDPLGENIQRIVYKKDLDAVLSSISWIVSHGNADNKKSEVELSQKALADKLYITCGKISRWAKWLLDPLNVESRLVRGLTLDNWNTYNNGHALLEIYREDDEKWVVYDLDNNAYFTDKIDNRPLSLVEFSGSISSNNYNIKKISNDIKLDVSNFKETKGYNYNFILEKINADIRKWYQRVMQVALIDGGDRFFYFFDTRATDRVISYKPNYKYLKKKVFLEQFYRRPAPDSYAAY